MYARMNNAHMRRVYIILYTAVPMYARAQHSVNARIVTYT